MLFTLPQKVFAPTQHLFSLCSVRHILLQIYLAKTTLFFILFFTTLFFFHLCFSVVNSGMVLFNQELSLLPAEGAKMLKILQICDSQLAHQIFLIKLQQDLFMQYFYFQHLLIRISYQSRQRKYNVKMSLKIIKVILFDSHSDSVCTVKANTS